MNQIECHPLLVQDSLLQYCQSKNIVVEAYSPLGQSKLINDKTVNKIASNYSVTSAQLLIRWGLQRGMVSLPKSKNPKRIAANFDVDSFEISADDMKALTAMNTDHHYSWDPYKHLD